MRAIVVVIVRTLAAKLPVQDLTEPTVFGFKRCGDPDMRETRHTEERSTPPFWTWFIENPRGCNYL